MRERPILFNAEMVQAILNGNKTQTRRVVKPQPIGQEASIRQAIENEFFGFKCPYGQVGDQLWVRENFQPLFADEKTWDDMPYLNYKTGEGYTVSYPATDGIVEFVNADGEVKDSVQPSIHMPRWASRIQLEITNIRVERLNDISEKDAKAEGVKHVKGGFYHNYMDSDQWDSLKVSAKASFFSLWESINGAGSWDFNPWVWVVEFKRLKP